MTWQNFVLGAVSIVFSIALIPAVIKRQGPPLISCVMTAVGTTTVIICYITLGGLWFASASTAVIAILWWILAWQEFSRGLRHAADDGTSITTVRKRTGAEALSAEEYRRHFGNLPTNNEG